MKWTIFFSSVIIFSSTCLATLVYYVLKRRRPAYIKAGSKPYLDVSEYNIMIINDAITCEQYFSEQVKMSHRFVGLDCEWISTNNNNSSIEGDGNGHSVHSLVALLQLAFPNKDCVLVRLCNMRELTPSLTKLLSDRSILKLGVGISNDVNRLARGYGVFTEGALDLRNVAVRCGIRRNCSLGGLTNQIVGRDLVKTWEITCSNWEQEPLTADQISYAAADAISALLVFSVLVARKMSNVRDRWGEEGPLASQSLAIQDDRVSYQSDAVPDTGLLLQEDGIKCGNSLSQGLIRMEFKQLLKENAPVKENVSVNDVNCSRRTSAYSVRKTPLYYNCRLIAPDGTLLSTVDQKKIDWYIAKELGDLICEDPPTVRLRFDPSGKPNKDREYYLTEKENVCVVCGNKESYIRKNIIPHEYRKNFPREMKEHVSHDVLLMCVGCHQQSDNYDRFMRREMCVDYGVPFDAGRQKYREDPVRVKKRSLARAIANRNSIPERRRSEMFETLAELLECKPDDITTEQLKELANAETRQLDTEFVSHGEQIVQAVMEREELMDFQRRWRVHFLETMKPQYLPDLWSVDHNPHRS